MYTINKTIRCRMATISLTYLSAPRRVEPRPPQALRIDARLRPGGQQLVRPGAAVQLLCGAVEPQEPETPRLWASKGLGRGACRCAAPGRGCPGAARLRIVYFGAPNAGVRGPERPFSGLKSSFSLALGAPHGCGQPPLPGELGQIPPNASKEV